MLQDTESNSNIDLIIFGKTIGDSEIIARTEKEIGYPCLVRPDEAAATLGISNVKNVHELRQGILKAFRCSDRIVIQKEELSDACC